ncbi:SoxR reducing system RseC family protein [Dechloromonas sp. XY25]|uniref:SoxR reducing system RseC family protein n=1 Tax=Dechloromonas hankyongensis TaxID=2908002 RepID=A0ABS9K7B7_9RHOO|nr:SoxR reducing system RseC family protein [Dechloromonas hankyongensis]MCG2579057.1 SoxR reducing system RseC family protein [Dechloromonas hankyongensis]
MGAPLIEHRGVVQRVDDGVALVAVETAGCPSCAQGSACGVGKMAAGRPATLLTIPVSADIKAGDFVLIGLPESGLTLPALLGYLFPAFAMLVGAWLGACLEGSDGSTALGAIAGFLGALAVARIVIGLVPGLTPAPQLKPLANPSTPFPKEHYHD